MDMEVKGSKELLKQVIDAGLCTLCGACAGGCPYLVSYKGRIVLLDDCTITEGQCYRYCPRTYTDMDAVNQQIFGIPYSGDELGVTNEVLMARSTDANIKGRAQYGGTVTAIVSLALEEGFIDGAILTKMSDDKTPSAFLARSKEEVLQCAGSNYMACPVLEALNHIPKDSKAKLGVVALPCQALALGKMRKEPPQNRVDIANVKLVIGLFCTWALSPGGFHQFLHENLDLPRVIKFDIPPPPANRFEAYTSSGKISFPLDEIRKFIMPACTYCLDMTSEFADISVGSVEGIEGWNTVIVRTDVGAELVEVAKAKGKLEVDALPPQNLAHLKEAALLKKKRALKEIITKSGDRKNLLYVGLQESIIDNLLA
jgi:coenzyme F420 hydrogenase subunit beta